MKRISVELGPRAYDVLIGSDHLRRLGTQLKSRDLGTHAVLISNPTILRRHGSKLRQALAGGGFELREITVPDSERSKSLPTLQRLLLRLADLDGPGRRLFLVLAGGGVVGDLGGLAAGLYRRGIPYVQVPTTLLAQVDSSLGGKTGVDLPQGKNLAGLFYQPRFVFIELDFLATLPDRQFRSGLAEVAKCGVILDAQLFSFLERCSVADLRRETKSLGWVIARAVQVKASVVAVDELETKGIRTILNFGHTLGHAIEAASHYRRAYTHGEAVALGMLAATRISLQLKKISAGDAHRIVQLIERLGLPTSIRGLTVPSLQRAMAHDKKWSMGKNRWVLPTGIGRCKVDGQVPERVVRSSIRSLLEG